MAVFATAASEAMGGEQERISLALLNDHSSLNRWSRLTIAATGGSSTP